VRRFADNALQIFEAAESAFQAGLPPEETTILIGREGELRVIQHSDWSLDRLQEEHGAAMAYRVSADDRKVRLEARAEGGRMLLESDPASRAACRLIGTSPKRSNQPSHARPAEPIRPLAPSAPPLEALVLLRAPKLLTQHSPGLALYEGDTSKPRLLEENEPILPVAWG
jgi:hypothetical protein